MGWLVDWADRAGLPHGVCLSWDPLLLLAHGGADLAMGLSYLAIAVSIHIFGRRRPDLGAPALFNIFAVVFGACGVNHFIDLATLWVPAYEVQGLFKVVAALASVATVAVMWRLLPRALAMPSLAQLRAVNAELGTALHRHRQADRRLRLLSEAVEQSSSVVIITDTRGVIQYVNGRFTEVSGYAAAEAIGQTPRMLHSGKTGREVYEAMWAALEAGQAWRGEFEDRGKDGRPYWVMATISPVRDESGRVMHYVAMQDDVTERKLSEARMREARELAEVASRAKSELLANMSHELRTPLNAIIGFSSALISGVLGKVENARHAEYLADIQSSAEHLLSLINDILDVSAIEVGRLNLHEGAVDPAALATASLRMVSPRAGQAGVRLRARLDPGLPLVKADERRLKQVLMNLLSNAVKFTPADGEVELAARLDGDGWLCLSVRDNGIGMSGDELVKAMEPFGQVDSSLARRYEGTGLGLPLTKGLVDAHGGELRLASEKGVGTIATVRLPPARVMEAATAPQPAFQNGLAAATPA